MGIWAELPGRGCASLQQELPLRSRAQGLVDPSGQFLSQVLGQDS